MYNDLNSGDTLGKIEDELKEEMENLEISPNLVANILTCAKALNPLVIELEELEKIHREYHQPCHESLKTLFPKDNTPKLISNIILLVGLGIISIPPSYYTTTNGPTNPVILPISILTILSIYTLVFLFFTIHPLRSSRNGKILFFIGMSFLILLWISRYSLSLLKILVIILSSYTATVFLGIAGKELEKCHARKRKLEVYASRYQDLKNKLSQTVNDILDRHDLKYAEKVKKLEGSTGTVWFVIVERLLLDATEALNTKRFLEAANTFREIKGIILISKNYKTLDSNVYQNDLNSIWHICNFAIEVCNALYLKDEEVMRNLLTKGREMLKKTNVTDIKLAKILRYLVEHFNTILRSSLGVNKVEDIYGSISKYITPFKYINLKGDLLKPVRHQSPVTPKELPESLSELYTNVEYIGGGGFARVYKAKRKKDVISLQ